MKTMQLMTNECSVIAKKEFGNWGSRKEEIRKEKERKKKNMMKKEE